MIMWEVNRWKTLIFIIVIAFLWELHVEQRFVSMWHYPKVFICGEKDEKIKNSACQPNSKGYVR